MRDITGVSDLKTYVDPDDRQRADAARRIDLGMPDHRRERRIALLSDLTLHAYINQALAEFFQLPYAASASRVPFRKYLYDQEVKFQRELVAVGLLEAGYNDITESSQLRLPVFLAIALRNARRPPDLWEQLAVQRQQARAFRKGRTELEAALERRDMKEAKAASRAMNTDVESLLEIARSITSSTAQTVATQAAQGNLDIVALSASAASAALQGLVSTSLAKRILWRLTKPSLLFLNNVVDESTHLTEALPAAARLWGISPLERERFFDSL